MSLSASRRHWQLISGSVTGLDLPAHIQNSALNRHEAKILRKLAS